MIGLTIEKLSSMSRQDAAALRAIADCYHPLTRNENMDVAMLKSAVQRGLPGALETLAELNDMVLPVIDTTPAQVASLAPMVDAGAAIRKAQVELGAAFMRSVQDTAARVGATAKLHPDDNPAAGAPDQHALADQVFSGGAIPTSENVKTIIAPDVMPPLVKDTTGERHEWTLVDHAPVVSIVSGEPDGAGVFAIGATAYDPARIFAGGGLIEQPVPNVHAAIPTPPPLPLATPQTLPLQSDAATTISPPPPPPPAPGPASASGAVATTSPAQVELDKAGLPWDARIHASTKTKTAKDFWTRRRGVDDTLVAEIEAQLRAAMAVPTPPAPPPVLDFAALNTGAAAPAPTFPALMSFITERIGAGRLNQAQVTAAVQAVGLESLNLVMARVDLVPAIMDELRKVAP